MSHSKKLPRVPGTSRPHSIPVKPDDPPSWQDRREWVLFYLLALPIFVVVVLAFIAPLAFMHPSWLQRTLILPAVALGVWVALRIVNLIEKLFTPSKRH